MKDLIRIIAQSLVDRPNLVEVDELAGNSTMVIELKVAKEDLGKVIGKQGRNAHAMRHILSSVSARVHKRVLLEIVE